nr:ribonuclease H-like domain-containing protein [Tanacetum cinerariifolium]
MPPKPDLVFHTVLIAVETAHLAFTVQLNLVFNTAPTPVKTDHLAFNVQLSPTRPKQDFSHIAIPSAPIIEDWVSDSEEEYSAQPIETTIPAATPVPTSPKSNNSGKRRNKKACFVCKSVDHLLKDCDYHTKEMAQPTSLTYAYRGHHKQFAPLTHSKPQKHRIPTAVFTQSKPVSNTAVRPVSVVLPNIIVTRPRHTHQVVTKFKSPIRRHITRSLSSRTSNSPPRVNVVQVPVGNPQQVLQDKGVIDSGCSRHMTGNMSYLSNFEELNKGYVAFGGNPKGGKITSKGKIKKGKLDFDDVYFVKELKFNLFSVSKMCDKKNSVLFTDTACLVLSFDFKLPDENQVLLTVPKENKMYNVNLKNIVPSGDLTCLFAKVILVEDYLQKFLKMIIRVLLVRKASNTEPLDETSPILKTFLIGLENQFSLRVKVIKSDNGTEFKNSDLNQLCGLKGIKREFSVPRTPQQNGIAER